MRKDIPSNLVYGNRELPEPTVLCLLFKQPPIYSAVKLLVKHYPVSQLFQRQGILKKVRPKMLHEKQGIEIHYIFLTDKTPQNDLKPLHRPVSPYRRTKLMVLYMHPFPYER